MVVVFHFLNALKLLVITDAVLSWVLREDRFPRTLTKAILDPLYHPLRSLLGEATGRIDLAPLVGLGAIFVLELLLKRSGNAAPR